jgi:hypothetical protein
MGPRTGLDVFGKRKTFCLAGIRTPDHPARSQVPIQSEISRFQRLFAINHKYVHIQIFHYSEDGNRKFIQKNPTRCNSVSKLIQYLYEAQHVSGDTPPIIRSLKLH